MSKEQPRELESFTLSVAERDREVLLRLGKKPVLKRTFGFMSIVGFASSIFIAWEGSLVTIQYGLMNGGSAGLVYQFVFIWIGVIATFIVVSELVSMAPVSGGQYHWVSMLAPSNMHSFLSYITGWVTMIGWQGSVAGGVYQVSSMLQGIIALTDTSYIPQPWQQFLLALGIVSIAIIINTRGGVVLPRFEGFMLILHVLGFFAILIPMVTLANPHRTAEEVFHSFMNGGNFSSQGVSYLVGTVGLLLSFCGGDGAIHMAEEIENASVIVPKAIIFTYVFNGTLAFAMLFAALFSVQDIPAALDSPTKYPFMEIFRQATRSRAGAAVMVAIIVTMDICALVAHLAATSRQLWSFARDKGVPGWKVFAKVEPKTSLPINSILLTSLISMLLQLINFGSNAVFQDLTSITVAGLYSSYLIAVVLLLYRRCCGKITFLPLPHRKGSSSSSSNSDRDTSVITLTNTANAPLTWGPFHVPGIGGIVLNAFVCCFLTIAWFFSFWPAKLPVTPSSMNYNCVLWGGVVLLSILYYFVWGKEEWSGPVIETEDTRVSPKTGGAR